jgi:hypothetical protein
MVEREYQANLIQKLKRRFPGCMVIKNDPNYKQGILDLTILVNDRWGMLEVKMSARSALQANQQYYVEQLDEMSFAAIIFPENEEEVLNALQEALQPQGRPCISKS